MAKETNRICLHKNPPALRDSEIVKKIYKNFDLTPAGIISSLDLRKPIYTKTTNYGHFGKKDLAWEQIVKM